MPPFDRNIFDFKRAAVMFTVIQKIFPRVTSTGSMTDDAPWVCGISSSASLSRPRLSDYYLPSVQASLMICFPGTCNWCPALPIRSIKRKGAIACQHSFGIRFYSFIHILYLHVYVHFMTKNQLSDQHISIFLTKRGWGLGVLSNSQIKLCITQ